MILVKLPCILQVGYWNACDCCSLDLDTIWCRAWNGHVQSRYVVHVYIKCSSFLRNMKWFVYLFKIRIVYRISELWRRRQGDELLIVWGVFCRVQNCRETVENVIIIAGFLQESISSNLLLIDQTCFICTGLFMALQPRIIACGNSLAAFAMAVRFITGPAVMAATSIAVGLRGVLLHIAIVQVRDVSLSSTSWSEWYRWGRITNRSNGDNCETR